MIKIMLKGRKQSDTYLATIRRHHWSAQMTMKKNQMELSASTVTFISPPLQLMKATVLAESFFHLHLCTPTMSTNSSQVGVALFPSF